MRLTVKRVVEEKVFEHEDPFEAKMLAYSYMEGQVTSLSDTPPAFVVSEGELHLSNPITHTVEWDLAGNMCEIYPVWGDDFD